MYNPNKLNEFVNWLRPLVNGDIIDSREYKICNFISSLNTQYTNDSIYYDNNEINKLNENYNFRPGMKSSRVIGKICRIEGWDKFEEFNRRYAFLADYLNPLVIKKMETENKSEDRWMIINTKMFLESPQVYLDMARNGINIYIQLDNGNKLKLGKYM